jgi:hypothetical protein
MTHLPPPSQDGDRSSLDEALFGGDLNQRPDVPAEVALGTLNREPAVPPLPAPLVGVPVEWPDEPPPEDPHCAVRDGGTEYQLAGLAPGLFEMRAVPAAPPAPAPDVEAPPPPFEPNEEPPLFDSNEEPPPFESSEEPPSYVFDEPESPEPVPSYEPDESDALPEYVFQEQPATPAVAEEPPPLPEEPPPLPEPRPPCVLQANEPLDLSAGETVVITAQHLRIGGPAPAQIDLMVLSPAEHGAILREGFALTGGDVFTQEDVDQGKISYRHDGDDARADRFTFATPDGDVQPTVFYFTIQPVHQAPELLGAGQLSGVLDSVRVSEILDGQAVCHEKDVAPGLAVVALAGRGAWHYSLDEGQTWRDLKEAHHASAVPLRAADLIRFTPRPGWAGTVKLTYRAWDGSQGAVGEAINLAPRDSVGSSTAFSRQAASATGQVLPQLPDLPPVDPWHGGLTMADLFGGAGAVVRLEGPGEWQFSTDGRSWQEFGKVYHGRARLLRATDRVRFVPRRGATGKVILAARSWEGRGASATANLASSASCGGDTPFGEFVQTRTWRLSE